MFKTIAHISDIREAVAGKKEIRFFAQPDGVTLVCYMFMDSKTFDSPEALECRGIAFDAEGRIVSRPLHKFFNLGEKEWLTQERLLARDDVAAVFDKLDGSMIATAWVAGELRWRSKKAFDSDVVKLAKAFLARPENAGIQLFAEEAASRGLTAVFELTHPQARIVVAQAEPALRLLHVRENVSGAYATLDPAHPIHERIAAYGVPLVPRLEGATLAEALERLKDMRDHEGYVVQFADGDMVKVKCPWYARLHASIALLRERDVAITALHGELDDLKGALREAGVDLAAVEAVEARLKAKLSAVVEEVDALYERHRHLERKDFALAAREHPLFGLAMMRYLGKEPFFLEWYGRARLKEDFSLRVLTTGALAEAMDG